MNILSETVEMLKQFKDFSLFSELGGIIQKLEDKIYVEKTDQPAVIHLDKNEGLKGLCFLDELYQAIIKKLVLKISYKSFKARQANEIVLHPFILKEFNNRWFIVGKNEQNTKMMTLALDRIVSIDFDLSLSHINEPFDGDLFYKNTIGVTVLSDDQIDRVVFKLNKSNTPYAITKPFHATQKVIEKDEDGSTTFEMYVHHNFELERIILGFGDAIEVIEPSFLRRRIKGVLRKALEGYQVNEG